MCTGLIGVRLGCRASGAMRVGLQRAAPHKFGAFARYRYTPCSRFCVVGKRGIKIAELAADLFLGGVESTALS